MIIGSVKFINVFYAFDRQGNVRERSVPTKNTSVPSEKISSGEELIQAYQLLEVKKVTV